MRRKWLIIGITGFVTLATVAFAIVSIKLPPEESPLPNVYTAEAVIFVLQNDQDGISDSILGALGLAQPGRQASGFSNGDMILEILNSRTIKDRLIADFKLAGRSEVPDTRKSALRQSLANNFRFDYARNTGSLKLSFSDTDPVFARDIVNRTVALLDEWFVLNRGMAKQKTKQNLEEKLTEVRATIDSLQNRLKGLQKKYGVLNAQELGVTQAESLANLRSQQIMKEIEIKNYLIYAKIDDPHLQQLNEELRNLQDLISKNQTSVPSVSPGEENAQRNIADVAQEFSLLTNELDIQQRIYNTLSPQYEAIKLTPESEPIFQVFELAEIPDIKSGPKRSKLVMEAFAGSLCFSIALSLSLNAISEWKKQLAEKSKKAKAGAVAVP
jgi:uncharacterized protein involved in exopolysaccharide biosynthesis